MDVTKYRTENPDEWAELILLFEEDLTDSPKTSTQQSALDLLELKSGESIEDAIKLAKQIMEER